MIVSPGKRVEQSVGGSPRWRRTSSHRSIAPGRSYFDIGNHVIYAPPQALDPHAGQTDCKVPCEGLSCSKPDGHGGKFVDPRDGSIRWPAVRQALDDVGYNGWLSIEDGGLPLDEFNRRLDLILAGKVIAAADGQRRIRTGCFFTGSACVDGIAFKEVADAPVPLDVLWRSPWRRAQRLLRFSRRSRKSRSARA